MVYAGICRYMKVYGRISRYMEVYGGMVGLRPEEETRVRRRRVRRAGGGRINAFRALPSGTYENWNWYIMTPFEKGNRLVTCEIVISEIWMFGDGLKPEIWPLRNLKLIVEKQMLIKYHILWSMTWLWNSITLYSICWYTSIFVFSSIGMFSSMRGYVRRSQSPKGQKVCWAKWPWSFNRLLWTVVDGNERPSYFRVFHRDPF